MGSKTSLLALTRSAKKTSVVRTHRWRKNGFVLDQRIHFNTCSCGTSPLLWWESEVRLKRCLVRATPISAEVSFGVCKQERTRAACCTKFTWSVSNAAALKGKFKENCTIKGWKRLEKYMRLLNTTRCKIRFPNCTKSLQIRINKWWCEAEHIESGRNVIPTSNTHRPRHLRVPMYLPSFPHKEKRSWWR